MNHAAGTAVPRYGEGREVGSQPARHPQKKLPCGTKLHAI